MSMMDQRSGGVGAIKSDPRAKEAMQRWLDLKTDRSQFETDWEDIARLIRPQRGGFMQENQINRHLEKPLSSAPIVAQSNLSSGLYGTLTNPANRWFGMRTPDEDLNDSWTMRQWLETVTKRVIASFRPSVSPFYDATIQLFSDITAFGNAAQYDEMLTTERKIMDVTLSLSEVVWDIDAFGRVVEIVRKFKLKPRPAARLFGIDNLPKRVQELAQKGSNDTIWFYQHVLPNDSFVKGMLGPKGKAWLSHYCCEVEESHIRTRGYDEMPFHIPRWEVESGFSCGTGPGFIALASARLVHRMDEATIRAAQLAADPTKLAPDRDAFPLHGTMRPGSVLYGAIAPNGTQLVRNMEHTGNIGLTIQEKQQKIEEIRDAFNWSLMNLAGRTGMTATEVMTIQEERQRLMAPHLGRIQHEFLRPKIERRFAMLWKAGQLPPPPPEAQGVPLEVEYQSAAAMAQRSQDGAAVMRIVQDLAPLAQLDPRFVERLDPDGTVEVLHEARGAPAGMLRSREQADQLAAERAQMEAQAAQMQAMAQGAATAKDAAAAAQTAGMVPA